MYKKILLLFIYVLLCGLGGFSQENPTRQQKKQWIKAIRQGKLKFSEKIDTVFIEKEVIRQVIQEVPKEVWRLAYRDTCQKTGKELRHERKMLRIENHLAYKKLQHSLRFAREETKRMVLENQAFKDSLKFLQKQFRTLKQISKDRTRTIRKISEDARKTDKQAQKTERSYIWLYIAIIVLIIVVLVVLLRWFKQFY
mgnify:CR=1 FL=1